MPLFPSGDEFEHFKMITDLLGMVPKYMIDSFFSYLKVIKSENIRTNKYEMYNKMLKYIKNYNYYNLNNQSQKIIKSKILRLVSNKETNSYELDALCFIIDNMLNINPYDRINIDQALCINQLIIDEYF